MSLSSKKILIAVTGSISTYKVCEVVSSLKKIGADVKVIATESALRFVGKASFEGLTGHPVLTGDFQDGSMMSHIQLAKWADIFVIAPATANTLNSLAQGTGGGIVMSTYLAWDFAKPLLIAPAMNTKMLEHPTTQASLKKLSEMSIDVLPTDSGDLACGDVGLGRLIEPQELLKRIEQRLSIPKTVKILITAGGTKVPIDSVRSITNTSSGKTGAKLADFFAVKNYQVDLLLSQDGFTPSFAKNVTRFTTYDDLARLMEKKIKANKYDLIIHAAAVSDFKVGKISGGKLASGSSYTITLEPTEKLLKKIKTWSKKSKVIGFKLTDTRDQKARKIAVAKIFAQGAELVVHNDLSEMNSSSHLFHLLSPQRQLKAVDGPEQLASQIEKEILA